MEKTKKSILVYLDNYPMVTALPPDQRGWLFTALMAYGAQLSAEGQANLEMVMDQFPLSSEARLVCGFMGANILRDTHRWLGRQQYRSRTAPGKGAPAVPAAEKDKRAREEMGRMRRLMEQMREG